MAHRQLLPEGTDQGGGFLFRSQHLNLVRSVLIFGGSSGSLGALDALTQVANLRVGSLQRRTELLVFIVERVDFLGEVEVEGLDCLKGCVDRGAHVRVLRVHRLVHPHTPILSLCLWLAHTQVNRGSNFFLWGNGHSSEI